MNDEARRALIEVFERPRYEVFPLDGLDDTVAEHVPTHATVTITASPRRGMTATLDLAERLSRRGFTVVPHLSARLIADETQLKEILDRLDALAVREAFVIGGDPGQPTGVFAGSYDLLVAMDRLGHRLADVGIAGYPESHPKIPDDVTIQAMWDKRHYASYLVSQICFDPAVIGGWVDRVRRRGVTLPIHLGVPGPMATGKLLAMSRRVGVGESMRFLAKHGPGLLRLARPGRYTPDQLLERLAPYLAHPDNRVDGVHIYTFNNVAAAEEWRQARLERLRAV